jgi:DNA-binding NtrC family response regulator
MLDAKVLLVDDEVPFVETMAKRLGKRDMAVSMAFSGMEALEKLDGDGSSIEVVVLDVKMPGMDGVETLDEIKRKHPLVEVIMLTGHATVSSAIAGMKKGAYDYLIKPCDIEELVTKVNQAVSKKRDHENKIVEARMKDLMRRKA